MKTTYKVTVGLEIHAELKTESKMFCDCINNPHHDEANTNICPVCTAQPGTLPVVNMTAVENVLKVGKALGSSLASFTEFDRKNYFYPDIPKAYQISQYQFPLVTGGELEGVAITRIHLEEDTARNLHDQTEGSVVDFNRAGVPLMELVTEPVIHDSKSAGKFAKELQLLLRTLGVSDANMEKGEMRVEANISISSSDELGTKVEVKNLNSFKSVELAIEYEIGRQSQLLESGSQIKQETRGWDEAKSRTFSQRVKETANDYRYFPDPDIPKYKLDSVEEFSNSRLNEKMPKLPNEIRAGWDLLEINRDITEVIIADKALTRLMTETLVELSNDKSMARLTANYVSSDVQGLLSAGNLLHDRASKTLANLIKMLSTNELNSRVGKDILSQVIVDGKDPKELVEELGLKQESSPEALLALAAEIISENEAVVAEYKAGKEPSLQFLVGQGMKKTKGAANPNVLRDVLVKEINK